MPSGYSSCICTSRQKYSMTYINMNRAHFLSNVIKNIQKHSEHYAQALILTVACRTIRRTETHGTVQVADDPYIGIRHRMSWNDLPDWRTCATRDDEPRPVWSSLLSTHEHQTTGREEAQLRCGVCWGEASGCAWLAEQGTQSLPDEATRALAHCICAQVHAREARNHKSRANTNCGAPAGPPAHRAL